MQERCHQALSAAGYLQYEISAFAQNNRQCQHNLNYWQFGDYLGIGAGAHSKVTDGATQTVRRTQKVKQPQRYFEKLEQGAAITQSNTLDAEDLLFEFALNALRLRQGFTAQQFEQATGLALALDQPPWSDALDAGLLELEPRIRASAKGWSFLNDLTALFLPSQA